MYSQMMIDIETLDVGPRAVVLSVAAILVSPVSGVAQTLFSPVSIQEQLAVGRTIDARTLDFWTGKMQRESPGAYVASMAPRRPRIHPRTVLSNLRGMARRDSSTTVWSRGPAFDQVIVDSLATDFDHRPICSYKMVRDVRTIEDMITSTVNLDLGDVGAIKNQLLDHDYVKCQVGPDEELCEHHPLYDCAHQMAVVLECQRLLGKML